jgi:polyhydroxybutyrate depolymerase
MEIIMKSLYCQICLILFLTQIVCLAQETVNGTIIHDGMERSYILYIPDSYTGDIPVPLVLNFHGWTSTAQAQMFYGDFRSIADQEGFLVIHPQGTLFQGNTHWNVGGWTVGSTVDDVGFTSALLDSISEEYNINQERIYSTGMSNGGFMSFLLACQLSNRIAAIASVTGSMTPETYNNSNPLHPTPIMQMHGTSDDLVLYGGTDWSRSIDDVLSYWVDYNDCDTTPIITALPDLDPNDGSTVEHYVFDNGNNGVKVEHFKITGGGHTWPGNLYGGAGTNYDINASDEIWNFFSKYDINGVINPVGIEISDPGYEIMGNFPNPFNPVTKIYFELRINASVNILIYNTKGEIVKNLLSNRNLKSGLHKIEFDGSNLVSGQYLYKIIIDGKSSHTKKMVLIR